MWLSYRCNTNTIAFGPPRRWRIPGPARVTRGPVNQISRVSCHNTPRVQFSRQLQGFWCCRSGSWSLPCLIFLASFPSFPPRRSVGYSSRRLLVPTVTVKCPDRLGPPKPDFDPCALGSTPPWYVRRYRCSSRSGFSRGEAPFRLARTPASLLPLRYRGICPPSSDLRVLPRNVRLNATPPPWNIATIYPASNSAIALTWTCVRVFELC